MLRQPQFHQYSFINFFTMPICQHFLCQTFAPYGIFSDFLVSLLFIAKTDPLCLLSFQVLVVYFDNSIITLIYRHLYYIYRH